MIVNFIMDSSDVGALEILRLMIKFSLERKIDMELACQNALTSAAGARQTTSVEILVDCIKNLDYVNKEGDTPLFYAANYYSTGIIKVLADRGANLDFPCLAEPGTTALHVAIRRNNADAVQALLECRMDPNKIDDHGESPLQAAIIHGPLSELQEYGKSVVGLLLKHGADPYLKYSNGLSPLMLAVWLDRWQEVDQLLKQGLSPNGLDANGNIEEAMPLQDSRAMVNRTLRPFLESAEPEKKPLNCCTPLCVAIDVCRHVIFDALLRHGADPNIRDPSGHLPLQLATRDSEKLYETAELIRAGASFEAKDSHGWSALDYALIYGGPLMFHTLIMEGASIQTLQPSNFDPIFHTMHYGHSEGQGLLPGGIVDFSDQRLQWFQNAWRVGHLWGKQPPVGDRGEHDCANMVNIFLENGSQIDTRDAGGRTMLHQAAFQICEDTIWLLLQEKADPNATDLFGQTPLHMAFAPRLGKDHFEELIKAGADPNAKDMNGQTPLHIVVRAAYPAGVRSLVRNKTVDLMAKDNDGNSALHLAVQKYRCKRTIGTTLALWDAGLGPDQIESLGTNNKGQTVWDIMKENTDPLIHRTMTQERSTEENYDNDPQFDKEVLTAVRQKIRRHSQRRRV